MSVFHAMCGAVVCALTVMACAVDDSSETSERQSLDAPGAAERREIPAELSFDQLNADKPLIATLNGCAVTMICHDPRHGNRPTFCGNGQCGGSAPAIAHNLCLAFCPTSNCSLANMIQLPQGC